MKISKPNGAQKGNMQSGQKKTPASEKRNGKDQTSGKKLVQARLPFKILADTLPSTATDAGSSSALLEVPLKKRKLSYTEESENPKKIGKCDSKENLTIEKLDSTVAGEAHDANEVVIIDDDDDKDTAKVLSPKTPAVTSKTKKSNKSTPSSAGSATTPKVLIKLPLSGKKKKRKSKLLSKSPIPETTDSSDVEFVSDGINHPTKKVKLSEDPEERIQEENSHTNDELHKQVDLNENPNISSCSPKVKQTIVESPRQNEVLQKAVDRKDNAPEDKSDNKNSVEQPKPIPKVVQSPQLLSDESVASDSKCDPENLVTPVKSRRSTRQSEAEQKKEEEKQICDEKLSPEPGIVSEKVSSADTSISEANKKLLTPKQIKLMEQRKQVREEKEQKQQQLKEERDRKLQEQREERERKFQEEKKQKQKEREERELQRKKERDEKEEQKRRERDEKEEQRRKEKDDRERKRLAEIEAKNEEKRKKDEAKEEERRKKEDERRRKELEKEGEENRKKKAAQAFTKFFVPRVVKPLPEDDQESREDVESLDSLAFRPFQVKGDMKLAPLVRREFRERSREKLDSFLKGTLNNKAALYIAELRKGKHIPLITSKTILKDDDDDVILIENELETAAQAIDEPRRQPVQRYKAKFYSFRENRRPPFYGTWRKKSTVITPRRPFVTDKKFFDYEVDSDDEWEEEEPGESLNGSDEEKDESEDEDYEVDNEWFVPHGHLSDEEMQNEDEIGPDTSREAQKAKLKALQQEFAKEMKKKTEKIKPRLIGAIWEDENGNRPSLCPPVIWDSLCTRAMMFCEPILVEEPEPTEPEPSTPPLEKQKRIELTVELMCDLVRLVHGNRHSRVFLIKEYIEHVSKTCETIKSGECLAPTKALIREKIDEISEWSVVEASNSKKKNKKKLCWVVSADVLAKYSLTELGLRNEWSYKLQAKYDVDKADSVVINEAQGDVAVVESSETSKVSESTKKMPKTSGITKFAKVLTKEEKLNQIEKSLLSGCSSPKASAEKCPTVVRANDSSTTKAIQANRPTSTAEKLSLPSASLSNKTPVVKKRVALLMSVPPGQQFSPTSKNALISKFLMKNKPSTSSLTVEDKLISSVVTPMDVDA